MTLFSIQYFVFGMTGSSLSPLMVQGNLNLVSYSEAPLSR